MEDRILRVDEVTEFTGLSRQSIFRRERQGDFPQRRKLSTNGGQAVGWLKSEVIEWVNNRPKVDLSEEPDEAQEI